MRMKFGCLVMRIHLNRKILMLTVLPVLATFGILYSHVQRSIIPNRSTENHTQHERRLKPIDTFNEVTAALQGDVTVEGVVPEKYETDLSEISTENKICPEQLLEQPKSIQGIWYCSECQQITCRKLLFGKVGDPIYEVSRRVMKRLPQLFNAMTRDVLMAQTIACHHFRKLRGYHLESSEEEKEFPIAFTILVHQDVVQTERLLRSIYRPQNVYCLHVDSKFQTLIEDLKNIVKCFDNVFIASKLEDIVYQGFSRLQADINCMRDLLMSITEWKYLLNTAATGFPLKTNLELVKTLKIYNGRNDIKTIRTTGDEFLENRFKLKWVERNGTLRKTNEPYPPPPHNLTIVKGNAYAVFSRAFVEFAIKDQRASDFLEWCRYTMTPDEHFWHTLHSTYANPHINAPGGFSGKYNNKDWHAMFVSWKGYSYPCYGDVVHLVCIYGVEDLPKLTAPETQHFNFLNKVFKDFEPLTLECLENWIEYKVACPPEFDANFYRGLSFVEPRELPLT